jgi:hypothetical protein
MVWAPLSRMRVLDASLLCDICAFEELLRAMLDCLCKTTLCVVGV